LVDILNDEEWSAPPGPAELWLDPGFFAKIAGGSLGGLMIAKSFLSQ
jgi:hypothetical protein